MKTSNLLSPKEVRYIDNGQDLEFRIGRLPAWEMNKILSKFLRFLGRSLGGQINGFNEVAEELKKIGDKFGNLLGSLDFDCAEEIEMELMRAVWVKHGNGWMPITENWANTNITDALILKKLAIDAGGHQISFLQHGSLSELMRGMMAKVTQPTKTLTTSLES